MINRCAVIVRAKEPFRKWLTELPHPNDIPLCEIDHDSEVYLLPACEDDEELGYLIEEFFSTIFEAQLAGWCEDEDFWPDRSMDTFKRWFDVEYHSCVVDLDGGPMEDDDVDEEGEE